MAESFPETPMMAGQPTLGWSKRAPNFFPDTPPGGDSVRSKAVGSGRLASPETVVPPLPAEVAPAAPRRDPPVDDAGAKHAREAQGRRHGDVEEAAVVEVRSGRLDTLGWVSASWEPRCVILRTDGSMSVQPLGTGRKLVQQQQQRASALPTPPQWSPMVKFNKTGAGRSVASTSTRTERMTSWASNSSSSSMKSGASSRVVAGFLGSNNREYFVAESPASSVASGAGSSDKVTRTRALKVWGMGCYFVSRAS